MKCILHLKCMESNISRSIEVNAEGKGMSGRKGKMPQKDEMHKTASGSQLLSKGKYICSESNRFVKIIPSLTLIKFSYNELKLFCG